MMLVGKTKVSAPQRTAAALCPSIIPRIAPWEPFPECTRPIYLFLFFTALAIALCLCISFVFPTAPYEQPVSLCFFCISTASCKQQPVSLHSLCVFHSLLHSPLHPPVLFFSPLLAPLTCAAACRTGRPKSRTGSAAICSPGPSHVSLLLHGRRCGGGHSRYGATGCSCSPLLVLTPTWGICQVHTTSIITGRCSSSECNRRHSGSRCSGRGNGHGSNREHTGRGDTFRAFSCGGSRRV